eukprot:g77032.t1
MGKGAAVLETVRCGEDETFRVRKAASGLRLPCFRIQPKSVADSVLLRKMVDICAKFNTTNQPQFDKLVSKQVARAKARLQSAAATTTDYHVRALRWVGLRDDLGDGVEYIQVTYQHPVTHRKSRRDEPFEYIRDLNKGKEAHAHRRWMELVMEVKAAGTEAPPAELVLNCSAVGEAGPASLVRQRFRHTKAYGCLYIALLNVLDGVPRRYYKIFKAGPNIYQPAHLWEWFKANGDIEFAGRKALLIV